MNNDNRNITILLIFVSTFGFAIQDTIVKILASSGSLWQLMLLRAFLVIIILLIWSITRGRVYDVIPKGWFWPILRGIFMSCAYTFFYASLPFVSLSKAATCFFTAPIFACIFAAYILKETIGWKRISAVCIGFLGVLLIIQPGTENMNFVLILPLLAGISYSLAVIITRGFCRTQPSLSLTFSHNCFYACLGFLMVTMLPILPFSDALEESNKFFFTGWVPLTKEILVLIGATSFTHIIAMTATIRAYQTSETSFVAPLEYFYLIFAWLIDYFLWQALPELFVTFGIILVASSGIIISIRENLSERRDSKG